MLIPLGLTSLFHSPFIQGAGAISIGGALITKVKELPNKLVSILWNRQLQQVTILKDESRTLFYEVLQTINKQAEKQIRQTMASCSVDSNSNLKIVFNANDATYKIRYNNKKIMARMIMPNSNNNSSNSPSNSGGEKKQKPVGIEFSSYSLSHKSIENFVESIVNKYNIDNNNYIPLSRFQSDYWYMYARTDKRPINTLIFNDTDLSSNILKDINRFLDNKKWYDDRYIPHRRGYLLYGEPGNGKTSLIRAIASELDMGIASLNLKNVQSDEHLNTMFEIIPDNVIVAIEDIDAMFSSNNNMLMERTKINDANIEEDTSTKILSSFMGGITFSGLLNALDGLKTCQNRIVFMTTNHKNLLDKALLRPGRCDMQVYIGNPTKITIARFFDLFFPDASAIERREFVNQFDDEKTCGAEIQEKLLEHAAKQSHLLETFSNKITANV